MSLHPNEVLIAPVVSEKSYAQIADRKYTFRVHSDAHKTQIRQAVEQLFDVQVEDVRPGWKKAVVKVREGQEIQIFEGAQV
jgi:large subunit ribosomal protein L23